MLSTLVVPLDGSPFGELALPFAARLAAAHGAGVHLVTVQPPAGLAIDAAPAAAGAAVGEVAPLFDPAIEDARRGEAHDYLARAAERLAGECGCRVTCAVTSGAPVGEAIAEEAARRSAGVVVLTSHGRGGFSRMWLGSTAGELLRVSPVPLLVVHARDDDDAPRARPEGFARVLLPVDGSATAERAIGPAVELGRPFGAQYVVLRVVRTGDSLLPYDQTFWTPAEHAQAARQQGEAERAVAAIVERLRGEGVAAEGLVVLEPDPARTILRVAAERGAGLVAMSTHARTGAAQFFVGGVTDKVIRGSPVPVLVVRPDVRAARGAA